jgi:hypothetical protein
LPVPVVSRPQPNHDPIDDREAALDALTKPPVTGAGGTVGGGCGASTTGLAAACGAPPVTFARAAESIVIMPTGFANPMPARKRANRAIAQRVAAG